MMVAVLPEVWVAGAAAGVLVDDEAAGLATVVLVVGATVVEGVLATVVGVVVAVVAALVSACAGRVHSSSARAAKRASAAHRTVRTPSTRLLASIGSRLPLSLVRILCLGSARQATRPAKRRRFSTGFSARARTPHKEFVGGRQILRRPSDLRVCIALERRWSQRGALGERATSVLAWSRVAFESGKKVCW